MITVSPSSDDENKKPHRPPNGSPPAISPADALGINDAVTPIKAYYDNNKKEYLIRNVGGRWQGNADSGIKRLLKKKGLRGSLSKAEKEAGISLTEVEEEMLRIQGEHDVTYCGPLAGQPDGFYEENGFRILITESPKLLKSVHGDWPLIRTILSGLVASPDEPHRERQLPLLIGWLACAVQPLYARKRRPGQALVLAGPVGCGKSVFQNEIVTPLLGGRSAKCAPFLQGRTSFNADLFAAEHLMLEDESSDTSIRSRLALASSIKQICVNAVQACHGKHRQIVNLCPFWRLTISLNDEPERLLVVPPLDADIADKLIILRCSPVKWPLPVATPEQWSALVHSIQAELPAFLHYLLNHNVPADLHSDRYGVVAWHHPDLHQAITDLAPEARLAELIVLWLGKKTSWTGTADQLSTILCTHYSTERQAREILRWSGACGTYLGKLVRHPRLPLTVESVRTANLRQWSITIIPEDS